MTMHCVYQGLIMYKQDALDLTVFNMKQLLRGSCLLYTFGSGHDATFVQPTFTVALMADASRAGLWLCGCFQLGTNPRNYRKKKTAEKESKHPKKLPPQTPTFKVGRMPMQSNLENPPQADGVHKTQVHNPYFC